MLIVLVLPDGEEAAVRKRCGLIIQIGERAVFPPETSGNRGKIASVARVFEPECCRSHTSACVSFKVSTHAVGMLSDVANVSERIVSVTIPFARENPSDLPSVIELDEKLSLSEAGGPSVEIAIAEVVFCITVAPRITARKIEAETLPEKRAGNRSANIAIAVIAKGPLGLRGPGLRCRAACNVDESAGSVAAV